MTSRSRVAALVSIIVVLALAAIVSGVYLASLSAVSKKADNAQSAPIVTDGTAKAFFTQSVQWHQCEPDEVTPSYAVAPKNMSSYECATVQAPLDWNNPDGETISLKLAVHRSGVENAPALFYNLGGPGGPAVDSLSSQVRDSMGDALVGMYDIVAMDPRGVGASSPIRCLTDHERDNFNAYGVISDADVETVKDQWANGTQITPEEEIAQTQSVMKQFGEGCRALSGELGAHIDTISVARDLDMVRTLMGQEKFNYLGYSYGTYLGATYADLFPSSVGRMVLDAAVDPAMSSSEVLGLQMRGFEDSVTHWVEDCQATVSCPLKGDVREGVAQVKAFLQSLKKKPLPTADPDRPLTQPLALTAIIGMMYAEEGYPVLTQAMTQAMTQRDGSILLRLADLLSDREEDGTYSKNSGDAIVAINSLDFKSEGEEKDWISQAMQLRSELDVMGEFVAYEDAALAAWPFVSVRDRKPLAAQGAAPIVVVGQTHDPATPYVMSQNLAGQLSSGVLVTQEGWFHGAYDKNAGRCVVDAVESYFVDGTVPADGTHCQ